MSSISNDLIWELTRANNAYLVKRKTGGGVQFSKDPFNLTNKHAYKYSGLANTKAVSVSLADGIVLKTTKGFNTPSKSVIEVKYKPNKTNRKVYKAIANTVAPYRSDLSAAAVSRASALLLSKKEKKTFPKKVRK